MTLRIENQDAGADNALSRFLKRPPWLLLLIVVVPNVLALIYFLFIAAPIYVSEAKFLVRTPNNQSIPTMAGLNTVLEGVGLKAADTEAFAVHEYIMSRNAVAELEENHDLRGVLGREEADFLARFPRPFQSSSQESLFKSYERFVEVEYDSTTGISTLTVEAFRPGDAEDIAEALLDQGEEIVNRLNDQAENDAIRQAQLEMAEAEARLTDVQTRLTVYRNENQIVDPAGQGLAGMEMIGQLAGELARLRAERNGLAASVPNSPQLPGLDQRIRAYQAELDAARLQIAGQTNSLAAKIGDYERLVFEREFLAQALAAAAVSLEEARMGARRKQLYLQRVVEPAAADSASLPKRWRNLLMVLITTLLVFGVVRLVVAGLQEHRQ